VKRRPPETDVETLAADYERLILEWEEALSNARKANRIFDDIHAVEVRLRSHEAGRACLEAFMLHPNRAVRLWSSSACLDWTPKRAVNVLEALEVPPDVHSMYAMMVLKDYRAGRLKFDW